MFSSVATRHLRAAFSAWRSLGLASAEGAGGIEVASWGAAADAAARFSAVGMAGLMSSRISADGGATAARLTPPPAETISGGMPRSLASESTELAGDDSRLLLGVGGAVVPERSARFSASSSTTRDSSHARCALRWLRERCADSRLRMVCVISIAHMSCAKARLTLASLLAALALSSSFMFAGSTASPCCSSWSSGSGDSLPLSLRARLAGGADDDDARLLDAEAEVEAVIVVVLEDEKCVVEGCGGGGIIVLS